MDTLIEIDPELLESLDFSPECTVGKDEYSDGEQDFDPCHNKAEWTTTCPYCGKVFLVCNQHLKYFRDFLGGYGCVCDKDVSDPIFRKL